MLDMAQIADKLMEMAERLTAAESEKRALKERLGDIEAKADKIEDLTLSIRDMAGRLERMDERVGEVIKSRRLTFNTAVGILQSLITTALLAWMGLAR